MGKTFIDLGIYPGGMEKPEVEKVVMHARKLGYRKVCLVLKSFKGFNFRVFEGLGIEVIPRLEVGGSTVNVVKKQVLKRGNLWRSAVFSVFAESKRVAMWAARNRWIDIIRVPEYSFNKVIDWSVARLLTSNNKAFELQTAPMLRVRGVVRSKLLKSFYVMVRRLLTAKTPVVVSSGANSVFEMRTPQDTVALATLVGLPLEEGLKGVSITPENIVLKVFQRKMLAGIPEGVKIVQKEDV